MSQQKVYKNAVNESIEFATALKILPREGNLAYEYNPFRNYRVEKTSYKYNGKLISALALAEELKVNEKLVEEEKPVYTEEEAIAYFSSFTSWSRWVPNNIEDPELIEPGDLIDFETDELTFDINHPVDILPLYSYDNSVNLILNDGKNTPRLINSRFSPLGRNKYLIVDRKGNNDTNIYDLGSQFDIDTSLYKRVVEIPRLKFLGVGNGGGLPVGNYHFYFRYADADGNETDFVAESGLVSIFIGNDPGSINSGFREENSHKTVLFLLSNVDSAYLYVTVYYTRSTSDILQNADVTAKKIDLKFLVNNFLKCNILITGYDAETTVTVEDINPMYLTADSVVTLEKCLNMLFLGNITKPTVPYKELEDLSLRFLPYISNKDYPASFDKNYNATTLSLGYYDPKYIYNNVGYWNHELYRLGIVYILSNSELSPVFNIRGIEGLATDTSIYTDIPIYKDGVRHYISIQEDSYLIVDDLGNKKSTNVLENAKGVIEISMETKKNEDGASSSTKLQVFGIGILVQNEVIEYLKNTLHIKGFFFVRLKRMPTILCQAYTIGIDRESHTPVLPVGDLYIAERFINDDKELVHDFEEHVYKFNTVRTLGAICPEYDVDSPYYNALFTGDKFDVLEADILPSSTLTMSNDRNFYVELNQSRDDTNLYNTKIIGVEDNVKLVAINDYMFSARAGEAEEAFRYEYIGSKNKITKASNLIRGSFGPYLGITGFNKPNKIIDIKAPGYSSITKSDLFKIRYNNKSSFYAISDRIDINSLNEWFDTSINLSSTAPHIALINPLYRGDCYICLFTHRMNRNFQDPSAPTNDLIVDPDCWKDNYEVNDGVLNKEKFDDINLGDVNAVELGMWVTMTIRSTKNLNIRATDDSYTDEISLTGHSRGFYPLLPLSADGPYKTPEALCFNKGFEKSLSERYNMEEPDVPAIKNDFTNRIAYSDIHVNDAFKNGFRTFQGTHYRDYPKTYGQITKLVEMSGNLLCVFEHGIGIIPVNERAVAGEGSGGTVYINTSNVLPENPRMLSDKFGSLWKDSIIKTPLGVYGVDTIGKKIWYTSGSDLTLISDVHVLQFLNDNITLTEREIDPIIGIRNVKSHYNSFKHDVMFTFYDNLHGFEEKAWNLCYNELNLKFITFYSWIPSYSENLYNQYFSFNRDTSKWITKLGVSHIGNSFADGVALSNNTFNASNNTEKPIGYLSLENRTLPSVPYTISYSLEHDNFKNYDLFTIKDYNWGTIENPDYKPSLFLNKDYANYCSELYVRKPKNSEDDTQDITNPVINFETWKENCIDNSNYVIKKDTYGRRVYLDKKYLLNGNKLVYLLNIKASIKITDDSENKQLIDAYYKNLTAIYGALYESVVAVIPEYNQQFLTTDFWKHGQAGIIDIVDSINPCYWYGKQHPFEFEFVVADNPSLHKIFDSLEIISNSVEPESFHYEIVGDCFDFAKDKKNMYIRLEATKELYLYNGSDIIYNSDYKKLSSKHRHNYTVTNGKKIELSSYDRSTILPLYYSRVDSINDIEDSYYSKEDSSKNRDYSALAGGEIIRYKTLDEYHIWNHVKAVNMEDPEKGRLRGNMQYKEDKWYTQINPLNIVLKNESQWTDVTGTKESSLIPIELQQSPLPNDIKDKTSLELPENWERGWIQWGDYESKMKETKLKDKWIKIRIRYTGDRLAIITAVVTLYSVSYA